ncbi:MAG: THUMP domain-containing protein [Thermoplasmata archaeon]|nr:THUMP domain-containing protein [Thermoplasmata archaeon]
MSATILVRYGELALKSAPVRREFEHVLGGTILKRIGAAGLPCRLRADHGHLYVMVDRAEPAMRELQTIFGITSVSEVTETTSDPATIATALWPLADPALRPGVSFAVRARRVGNHSFSSQELARDLGAAILERWPDRGLHVDLTRPDVELTVEVRGPVTYLYLERTAGPGGLPPGVAGPVTALVDGPRGALGAYLMMKRGCRVALVTTGAGAPLVEKVLRRYSPESRVVDAPGDAETAVGALADASRADAIVLALTVDQYPAARQRWGDRVLFSPTVGLTDEEVESRWREIARHAA